MCIKQARNPGFTLPELMITLAIAGILMAIAIPSFNTTIRSSRLSASANELVSALNLARSEAVKRGQQVVVRQNGGGWENGWQVFVDVDQSGIIFNDDGNNTLCEATEDCLLRNYPPLPTSYTLRGNNNFVNSIRYMPAGTISNAVGGSFVACDNSDGDDAPQANTARLIIVTGTGRVRMGSDTNNNGIPEVEILPVTDIDSCIPPFS